MNISSKLHILNFLKLYNYGETIATYGTTALLLGPRHHGTANLILVSPESIQANKSAPSQ